MSRSFHGLMVGGPWHGRTLRHVKQIFRVPRQISVEHALQLGPGLLDIPFQDIVGEYRWEGNGSSGAGVWFWKTITGQNGHADHQVDRPETRT